MRYAAVILVGLAILLLPDPLLKLRHLTGTTTLEDQAAALEGFIIENKFGNGSDYWLVKANSWGGPDRVALVFGVIDDFEMCADLAELYMRRYPADRYTCEKAN